MFEAARILDLEKVVWASSVAVFGAASAHSEGRIANDAPHRPNTLYGAYKSTCEQLGRHYTDVYGVDTIGLRYGGVYGLGRNRGKTSFSTTMIEKAVAGEAYTIPFATDLFGWHFVEDAAEVTIRAVDSAKTRTRSFNTHWALRSVADGVRYLKTLVPRAQFELEPGTMDIAWNVDAQVLEDELRYKPRHTMEDGIRKTVEAVQKERKSGIAGHRTSS
jgi:nucleoside-diphosphate-sugar epimerase